jgi:hypothetical protein
MMASPPCSTPCLCRSLLGPATTSSWLLQTQETTSLTPQSGSQVCACVGWAGWLGGMWEQERLQGCITGYKPVALHPLEARPPNTRLQQSTDLLSHAFCLHRWLPVGEQPPQGHHTPPSRQRTSH